jgi:hypothetical protein
MESIGPKSKFSDKIDKLRVVKKRKVGICPIISQMLKSNNNEVFKRPVIDMISNFINLTEKLTARFVCKQWDEIIKPKISNLKKENIYNIDKKLTLFENDSEKKYSKKKVLVRMLNTKSYTMIKKRTSLEGMMKTKNLVI